MRGVLGILIFIIGRISLGAASLLSAPKTIPSSTQFEFKIPLKIVILAPEQWTEEEIILRIRRTENIYAVCKTQFSPITIHTINNKSLVDLDFTDGQDIDLIHTLALDARPLVFFARKNTAIFAYDAYSWAPFNSEPPRTGTAFIFEHMKYVEKYWIPSKAYEVLAHELGHILLNEDHNTIPNNLMAKKASPMGDQLTPEQCQKINF